MACVGGCCERGRGWFDRSWVGRVELSGRSEVGERCASKSDRKAASCIREVDRGGVSLLNGLLDMDKVDGTTFQSSRVPRSCSHNTL